MTPWRLELLRLWRTRRAVALGATFLLLGLGEPIVTYELPELVKHAGNGVRIIAPEPTAADAIEGFVRNAAQLGTLVVAIVVAATVALDAHPLLGAFYRTRVRDPARLLLPRFATALAASVAALALGTAAAWYETTVVFGHVDAAALARGLALQALWLCFVASLVTLATTVTRSALAAVGAAIALLLGVALLGNVSALSPWLPSRLAAADHLRGAWHAVAVTLPAIAASVALAVVRLGRREPG